METENQHVPVPVLHEAAERRIALSPAQWWHIHSCEHCLLYLAGLVDVRATVEAIRRKIVAA